ncbi:hypothetical protein GHK92_16180 [Nocardioides sp. dk4132]|nr:MULTISPECIES: hypothetical protein [unclassified Nocardioides]MQW77413.1 hypothetical protein [Nocardioides sp. dk4132]
MYESTNQFWRAEMDYRNERIRAGASSRRRGRRRARARRPAEATDNAR